MGTRRRSRFGWLTFAALAVALGGIAVAIFAYGPGTVTTRGIDPIEYRAPAFYYRMWTVVATVAIAVILVVVDALRRVGDAE